MVRSRGAEYGNAAKFDRVIVPPCTLRRLAALKPIHPAEQAVRIARRPGSRGPAPRAIHEGTEANAWFGQDALQQQPQ